jgi:hypothetical protein
VWSGKGLMAFQRTSSGLMNKAYEQPTKSKPVAA